MRRSVKALLKTWTLNTKNIWKQEKNLKPFCKQKGTKKGNETMEKIKQAKSGKKYGSREKKESSTKRQNYIGRMEIGRKETATSS